MSRIPVTAGVALVSLLPLSAAALGLGEVEPRSFLNQPFAADIPVFAETADELAGLQVSLASSEAFARHGLQMPGFAGDFSFAVATTMRGGTIHITSTRPIIEPFLTLLLEVEWPQGRLLREYTVLLDPPAFAAEATSAAAPAPVAAPAAPAPASSVPERQSSQSAAVPEEAPAPSADSSGGYHTVAPSETLWRIAERYRLDDSIGVNQMMMAIYRANPQAFAGNINRLNAGASLQIPDAAAVADIASRDADAEVRRQMQEWRETVGQPPVAARLELVPPAEPGDTAGAAGSAAAAAAAEEDRRLLAVKDAELAALRQRVAELEAQLEPGAVAESPPAAVADMDDIRAEAEDELAEPAPGTAEAAQEAESPGVDAAVPAEQTVTEPVPARPAPAAESAGGLLDTVKGLLGSFWLWLAAALVLLGALLLARRRSAVGSDSAAWRPMSAPETGLAPEAEPAEAMQDAGVIVTEEPAPAPVVDAAERRSMPRDDDRDDDGETLLERTISSDSAINLDQADPLAEAEFHVAYGLYDQAADILVAALEREPERQDLQFKLLDVYFGWENREAFQQQAEALHAQLADENDPDWKRVCIMGRQLCPGEELFASGPAPSVEDMDLVLGDEALEPEDDTASHSGIDFDLSGIEIEVGADEPTMLAPAVDSDAPTMLAPAAPLAADGETSEVPTVELAGPDIESTMETPTIESPELSSTLETPTIEMAVASPTVETPTLESPGIASTERLEQLAGADDLKDQTAEIDLEDLGLDFSELDAAVRGMDTGLQEALSDEASGLDFDLSEMAEDAMVGQGSNTESDHESTLEQFNEMFGDVDAGTGTADVGDETAEHPGLDFDTEATLSTQRLELHDNNSSDPDAVDFELELGLAEDDVAGSDLTSTGLRAIGGRLEDPTMTEVGTKLDLARAYMDMDDHEGARSILNEVLEEGDSEQRQEASQLLDGLERDR